MKTRRFTYVRFAAGYFFYGVAAAADYVNDGE